YSADPELVLALVSSASCSMVFEITSDRRCDRPSCKNLNDRPRVGNVRSARQSRAWRERAEEERTIADGMRDAEDGASRSRRASRASTFESDSCGDLVQHDRSAKLGLSVDSMAPQSSHARLPIEACNSCGACCSYSRDWPRFTMENEDDLSRIPRELVD